ncbi:hypothetical protein CCR85_04525 [Rhodothalassium salexigens]|nr:hypothetical protein [Rhodothalassium salexigens]
MLPGVSKSSRPMISDAQTLADRIDLPDTPDLLVQFIRHMPVAVAMFDSDLRYLAASARWYQDYGLVGRSIIGQRHYDIFPEIPERWRRVHARNLAGERLSAAEDRFLRADGRVDYVQWENVPWRNADGSIGGVIMFTQVVTEAVEMRRALEQKARELQFYADYDYLTNVYNRRKFVESAEAELQRQRRYDGMTAFALVDLDDFKTINDSFGHAAGDEVLRRFAALAQRELRPSDVIGRVGGEEFGFLFPETDADGAAAFLARLRGLVKAERFHFADTVRTVTFSGGLAMAAGAASADLDPVMAQADAALLSAKASGKDRLLRAG